MDRKLPHHIIMVLCRMPWGQECINQPWLPLVAALSPEPFPLCFTQFKGQLSGQERRAGEDVGTRLGRWLILSSIQSCSADINQGPQHCCIHPEILALRYNIVTPCVMCRRYETLPLCLSVAKKGKINKQQIIGILWIKAYPYLFTITFNCLLFSVCWLHPFWNHFLLLICQQSAVPFVRCQGSTSNGVCGYPTTNSDTMVNLDLVQGNQT